MKSVYTLKEFGAELYHQIDQGYEIKRIAQWAYSRYLQECGALEPGLREKIMEVVAMEEGEEFEMSEDELRDFSSNLCDDL